MSASDQVVLAHRGELDGIRPYAELQSPFEASRIVLLPLCAKRTLPEKIIPPLRLSLASAKSGVVFVPILEKKLAPTCTPDWTRSYPCARCVLDRFRELLGAQNPEIGSPKLERLDSKEEVESRDTTILRFVQENPPPFAFVTDSPETVPLAWFKHSRKPAAMWFADVLLVQSRRRVPSADDIEALIAMKPPPRPSVEQAARARYKDIDLLTSSRSSARAATASILISLACKTGMLTRGFRSLGSRWRMSKSASRPSGISAISSRTRSSTTRSPSTGISPRPSKRTAHVEHPMSLSSTAPDACATWVSTTPRWSNGSPGSF